jgi:membrane protease YdiL (CAAX protease family)
VVLAMVDEAGVFQRLYGPDFPKLSAPRPPAEGLAAAGGGVIEYADSSTRIARNQLRAMWAGFLVVPLMVGLVVFLRWRLLEQPVRPAEFAKPLPGRIVLGVWTGLFLVPVCFAVHALSVYVATAAEVGLDRHPLSILRPEGDGFGGVVFGLSVILVVPILEELLFRGLLVNWASAEWHHPWIVMLFAVAFALRSTGFKTEFGPMVFLALLGVGLYLIQRLAVRVRQNFPTRTASAVWASAALFAVAHSGVWPSPVPLFVFGLGLGYLVARCRDITAAVVVHGMFNAVSYVYLLRGGVG